MVENDRAELHLEAVGLYYESMAALPNFRRSKHYGKERGMDAAPWGLMWERDRKKARILFGEQKGGE